MAVELTKDAIDDLPTPERGNRVYYDTLVTGFGVRVTAQGTKSYVLNYRTRDGRERRFTIGKHPSWKLKAAREEASRLRVEVDRGGDPLGALADQREARRAELAEPTVADLCDRFLAVHGPKLRPSSKRDYESIIKLYVRPQLGSLKVRDVTHDHIASLHRKISKQGAGREAGGASGAGAPARANRTVAVLSKMFSFAERHAVRDPERGEGSLQPMRAPALGNPARGVERNAEHGRERFLSPEEVQRLTSVLASYRDTQAAAIIGLLALTGARKGEVLSATWAQFDLAARVWTKPPTMTKQRRVHRVPLSAPAARLLEGLRAAAEKKAEAKGRDLAGSDYLFPARRGGGHRVEIKDAWQDICLAAELVERTEAVDADGKPVVRVKPSARIHDLRHSFASLLASNGLSLPVIGALLGHSQPQTTARYAHLLDSPLRAATEAVGAIVSSRTHEGAEAA